MAPRRKRMRRIFNIPTIKGFKPYGNSCSQKGKRELISLFYEEYEALRLCDYEKLTHAQACRLMQISRPTFTRIYASAREKIATAFVEGKQMIIEGGKVYFDSEWYRCSDCSCHFNHPDKEAIIENCPLCHSTNFHKVESEL
ncbi:MAG TPA: DUF134 domain-containing protein [Bacteroidales bacterium]|nr:DUF134 domain-containing protein [Bacteroidales bacterium]